MSPFKTGDRVKWKRGTHLHKGVFVLANSIFTVQNVREQRERETVYELLYQDKEMMPHMIGDVKESELTPAEPV